MGDDAGVAPLYVGYRDGWPVGVMTIDEWAERMGTAAGSMRYHATPSYCRRHSDRALKLYRVDDDEEAS